MENSDKIDNRDIEDIFALTPMQAGMLFHHRRDPGGDLYFEQLGLRIFGEIDTGLFEQAWAAVIGANEMLRTVFRWQKVKEPVQVVLKEVAFKPRYYDLTQAGPSLEEIKARDRQEKFDLRQPAFRVTLVTVAEKEYELIIGNHHILFDGWSSGIILREFLQAYDDLCQNRPVLKPRKHRFKEFVQWRQKQAAEAGESFWQHYLAGFDPGTQFFSRQREPDNSGTTERYHGRLPQELSRRLMDFTRRQKLTPAVLLYSAFGLLLQRYGDCDEAVFGTTVSGRPPQLAGIEEIVGLFINTLPLRVQGEAADSTEDLVHTVQQGLQSRKSFEYSSLPDIKRFAGIDGTGELFHSMVAVENYPLERHLVQVNGSLTIGSYTSAEATHYALTLTVSLFNGIAFTFLYDPAVLDPAVVFAMAGHFQTILWELTAHPARQIGEIDILSAQEKETILYRFNDTESPYPTGQTIAHWFETQAETLPDHTALVGEDRQLSYAELNRRAGQLADRLYLEGVLADTVVGVRLARSIEMVAGVLAVLKAGAAYLPIDPDTPEERVTYMLRESGSRFVLDDSMLDQLPNSPAPQACPRKPGSLAYCIYTSGTSGRPRGVLVDQAAVIRLVKGSNYINFRPDDRLLQTGALAFDASTFEIWGALLNGLTLYLVAKEKILSAPLLKEITHKNAITIMWLTASLFNQLLDADIDIFAGLRYLLAGGEALSPPHINRLRQRFPALNIVNGYGPTENTTFSTTHLIEQEHQRNIPIGRPIAHSTAYVVDRQGRLQPVGAVGELWLGGRGLARGYLNNPDLTAEKFINLAAKGREGTRSPQNTKSQILNPKSQILYRTGDLCRWLSDGNLEFLGRLDFQVKIRGFRLEPAEIETLLRQHEAVKEAVVLVHTEANGEKSLTAYTVPQTSRTSETNRTNKTSPAKLRQYLAETLPVYMIPTHFVSLPEIPLTPNGKVDRKALPQPTVAGAKKVVRPRKEMERTLARLWSEVLAIPHENIGIESNFFELGGHSLKAASLVSRIHKRFNVNLPLREIFQNPYIKGLAEYIEAASTQAYQAIDCTEQKAYYPVSSAQHRMYILQRSRPEQLNYNIPVVMELEGRLDTGRLEQGFCQLVARHESLRTGFEMVSGRLVQRVAAEAELKIDYYDGGGDIEQIVDAFIRPFDLSRPPLLRVGLVAAADRRHLLMVDMHHIGADGSSAAILVSDLMNLYAGEKLPRLRVRYRDYAEWEHSGRRRTTLARQEQYWLQAFETAVPRLNLPLDFARAPEPVNEGRTIRFSIDQGDIERFRRLTSARGVTPFMLFLSLYYLLLARVSGGADMVVGTGISARSHEDLRHIVGMFVNTLALRHSPDLHKTFKQFLEEVKERVLHSLENRDYPFEQLVEQLGLAADPGRNPLFDVMYQYEDAGIPDLSLAGIQVRPHELSNCTAKFDLTLWVFERAESLSFAFEYALSLFSEPTVQCLIGYFRQIAANAAADPDRTLQEIAGPSEEAKAEMLRRYNENVRQGAELLTYPTLQQMVADRLDRFKDRTAAEYGSRMVTAAVLDRRSAAVARTLRLKGVGNGDFVGVLTEDRLALIAAMIGIMGAGAAVVPLDSSLPQKRLTDMAETIDLTMVISDECLSAGDCADSGEAGDLWRQPYDPADRLYVYFTSGTSGRPKAVVGKNESVVHFICWEIETFNIQQGCRVSQLTNPGFDAFLRDVFVPLCAGGVICIPPTADVLRHPLELVNWLDRCRINLVHCVPSLFRLINDESLTPAHFSRLHYVLLSGERVEAHDLVRWYDRFGKRVRLVNLYGPSETTMIKTLHLIRPGDIGRARVPIGRPMKGAGVLILDGDLNICDRLVSGDIYIGTPYRTYGYFRETELNRQRFIVNPFSADPRDLLFKTGDRGRWLSDWSLDFLGRDDRQVKIHGVRVELAEIETSLATFPSVKEAAVRSRDSSLCAYVTLNQDSRQTDGVWAERLREFLAERLPSYMVPTHIVPLSQIPRLPSGKVDYRRLPEPLPPDSSTVVPPENERERQLLQIWRDLLGVEDISTGRGFFAAGGNSLTMMSLISRIHREFDVRLSLSEIFKNQTIRGQANLIRQAARDKFVSLLATEKRAYYPLAAAQQRIYMIQQMNPHSTAYNITTAVVLAGDMDRQRFCRSFRKLISRHESLRTGFEPVDGLPVQRVHDFVDFKVDCAGDEEARPAPFDLTQPPLLRVALVRECGQRHILKADIHHIIADGTSMGIMLREFLALYEGGEPAPLKILYRDYAAWQNREIESAAFKQQAAYWLGQFADDIPVLNLPLDYPRPPVQSFEGSRLVFEIGEPDTAALRSMALQQEVTLFMLLLTVYTVWLSRLCGQEDIVVGTPEAGRGHAALQPIIGMFVNMLALRNYPAGEKSFRDFLQEVRTRSLAAFENREYPFDTLVEQVVRTRDMSRNPLFDVVFSLQSIEFQKATGPGPAIPGLKLETREIDNQTAKFDVNFTVAEQEDRLACTLEYCTSLFTPRTMERYADCLRRTAASVLKEPGQRLREIEMIAPREKHRLLYGFNDTVSAYPANRPIHRLFIRQAVKTPDHIAVLYRDRQLSYAGVNNRAERLAGLLKAKGIRRGEAVGIMAHHCPQMVMGVLGILLAGAAYLPVNPGYPRPRREFMLTESGAGLLLTDRTGGEDNGVQIIDLNRADIFAGDRYVEEMSRSDDPAYMIYTSGSTGRAKGVLVEHRSVVRLVKGADYIDFHEGARLLQTGALEFDASTFEIWGALLNGLRLCLTDKDVILNGGKLREVVLQWAIDIMWLTAPLFNQLFQVDEEIFAGLTYLLVGGDVLSRVHINQLRARYPGLKVINGYGPTENTTFSTTFLVDREYGGAIPIGRPIANSTAYVIGRHGHLQPINVPGELYVGGDGVSRGYLNDPEQTAAKFVNVNLAAKAREGTRSSKHEILTPKSQILYRTGDLCRWLPDGTIEFLGRLDHQVKIRGFRLEPGEIEHRLSQHEAIKEALVLVRTSPNGEKSLTAYIVPQTSRTNPLKLRQYLSRTLPDYMIPAYFVELKKIPLTVNGKVDRRALPEPRVQGAVGACTPPANETERRLAAIWSHLLDIAPSNIDVHTSFFALGGHSLNATLLSARIHKEMKVRVPLVEIFSSPTIRELSAFIRRTVHDEFISIVPTEEREYYPLSSPQRRLYVLQQMDVDLTVYNVPTHLILEGSVDRARLKQTFQKLIDRHESLRTSFRLVGEEPVQQVHRRVNFEIDSHDSVRPFDLSAPPLLRVGLVTVDESHCLLMLDTHHIVTDGISMGTLVREFMALYRGESLPLLRLRYRDYVPWQEREGKEGAREEQQAYWLKELSGDIPVLNLPTDFVRPAVQGFSGSRFNFFLKKRQTEALKGLSQASDATLFMTLLALFTILLSRLSGQEDIVVGTPVAGRRHADLQPIIGMFVNTLALRNYPVGGVTFIDFLRELKTRTLSAFENQEYPFEDLVERLDIDRNTGRNPLFDVMFAFQDLQAFGADIDKIEIPGLTLTPRDFEIDTAKFDLNLIGFERNGRLFFSLEYGTALFKQETVERFVQYFRQVISAVSGEPAVKIGGIEIIPDREKDRILYRFNNTGGGYVIDQCIHRLFEAAAAARPDHLGLVGTGLTHISYGMLNGQAYRLARLLKSRRVERQAIVAIKMRHSIDMIVALLGILKVGALFLPIDPDYPEERVQYMLADSCARMLLTDLYPNGDTKPSPRQSGTQLNFLAAPANSLAYCIYTSGSSGRPKGVGIEHRSLVNLCRWHNRQFAVSHQDRAPKYAGFGFDASVWEIFPYLSAGASLHIIDEDIRLDIDKLLRYFERQQITIAFLPTQICEQFMDFDCRSLRILLTGGDKLKKYAKQGYRLVNNYGPTENTVVTTSGPVDREEANIPIGKPVMNCRVYILDTYNHLQPVGVPGELCIAGDGLARGYLNNPELTADKFFDLAAKGREDTRSSKHQILTPKSYILYRTGDLARFLPDGSLEFLGRLDQQVKVRGNRIELGEIESRLLAHPAIKEAVVLVRPEANGEKSLTAYTVPQTNQTNETSPLKLRQYLSRTLPGYMIPAHFVQLEQIPLTPNGKVDRTRLPEPQVEATGVGIAPADEVEARLVLIWSEILSLPPDSVSTDADFFASGGHSLKATNLAARIHREFAVQLPLTEIFRTPHIRGLAEYIRSTGRGTFTLIKPVEEREYYTLSSAQKRLYVLQQMAGAGIGYNMPTVIELYGEFDTGRLSRAFGALIRRHESLRTSFTVVNGEPVQRVHEEVDFKIEYYKIAAKGAKGREIKNFIRPFDLSQPPLLRVGLITPAGGERILVVDMHHIIGDGTSIQVLIEEFWSLYGGADLPGRRIHYKDYACWQAEEAVRAKIRLQQAYWLAAFAGEIPVLELPVDYPRPVLQSFEGRSIEFELGESDTQALESLSLAEGVTLFMLLLALYNLLLAKLCGQQEVIVGTPLAGRRHTDLARVIGMFINTLALRNYPAGERRFREFLGEVKARTLAAFENQEYPFEELVERVAISRDVSRNPLFDVVFALQNIDLPQVEPHGLRARPYPYEIGISKFDMTLQGYKAGQRLVFRLEYCTKLFKEKTINRFIRYFERIVSAVKAEPGQRIFDIEIITDAEKREILVDFNRTAAPYPSDSSMPELFAAQAARIPHHIALVVAEQGAALTYRALNEQADRLAASLKVEGVGPGTIVGLTAERSAAMISAIFAILKAGGAYLPIDPGYPEERRAFMLADSGAAVLLTADAKGAKAGVEGDIMHLERLCKSAPQPGLPVPGPASPVYVIYTSGTTGRPKGVMIESCALVNRLNWMQKAYPLDEDDTILHKTPFTFDVSVWEIFWWAIVGARVCLLVPGGEKDPELIGAAIERHRVTTLHFVPSMLNVFLDHGEDDGVAGRLRSLKRVFASGEALTLPQVRRFNDLLYRENGTRLVNLYGPTEATVDVTFFNCPGSGPLESVPIGKPIDNINMYIVDRAGHLLPPGVAGELCTAGVGLARGYLNQPELTADKFANVNLAAKSRQDTQSPQNTKSQILNPKSYILTPKSQILYRTGDLARWLSTGDIEFLGRLDHQVKIRGFRIELAEIESQLLDFAGAAEAVVTARESAAGERQLTAYVVPAEDRASTLRRLLEWEREGRSAGIPSCELANGMTVFYLNRHETDFMYAEIFGQHSYTRHGISLKRGACIFDIGANIGLFALFASRVCEDARVYCFEPIPPVYRLLALNTALYGSHFRLFNYGLAAQAAEVEFTYYPHATILSGLYADAAQDKETVRAFIDNEETAGGDGQAPSAAQIDELLENRLSAVRLKGSVKTLSQVIEETGVEEIDLLKIDVEKGELAVLKGIGGKDWPKIRQVVMEVHDVDNRLAGVVSHLEARGFEVFVEQERGLENTGIYTLFAVRPGQAEGRDLSGEGEKPIWQSRRRFIDDLKGHLKKRLPDYMIPPFFVLLDRMPLTANGKIDRRALPAPQPGSGLQQTAAPRNRLEERLVHTWSQVLNIEESRIGLDTNFFELGGHSLTGTVVLSRIHKELAIKVPLSQFFRVPTIRGLSGYISSHEQVNRCESIQPVEKREYYELSSAQKRLYLLQQMDVKSTSYNMPGAFVLSGALNRQRLTGIFLSLIARHETLRTSFVLVNGRAVQKIGPQAAFKVEGCGIDPGGDIKKRLSAFVRPFDLGAAPLLRVELVESQETGHVVLYDMHHIVSDGISLEILEREFTALYEEQSLDPLHIQYKDYTLWQNRILAGEESREQERYWLDKIRGLALTRFPAAHFGACDQAGGEAKRLIINKQMYRAIETFCHKRQVTRFMFMMTLFNILLALEIGQMDITVGIPFANRDHYDLRGVIGIFLNVLLIRTILAPDDTLLDALAKTGESILGAMNHSAYPYERLNEKIRQMDQIKSPELFTILVNYFQVEGADEQRIGTQTVSPKYEATLYIRDTGEEMVINLVYMSHIVGSRRAGRIMDNLSHLNNVFFQDSRVKIRDIELLDDLGVDPFAQEMADDFEYDD
jgi:tyrocidine synthetase-3